MLHCEWALRPDRGLIPLFVRSGSVEQVSSELTAEGLRQFSRSAYENPTLYYPCRTAYRQRILGV
jgi:hypothetical protein